MRTLDATFALKAEDVSITDDPSIPLDARADRPPSAPISDAIVDDSHLPSEHSHDPTMNSSATNPYAP
ncbi:hypothetical protein K523DRAFT_350752 [Schizophyllum commune Tattone D]|nr:hypothetical protein K523DRAFT_350752 [Schizophyllum commune Tattone D]